MGKMPAVIAYPTGMIAPMKTAFKIWQSTKRSYEIAGILVNKLTMPHPKVVVIKRIHFEYWSARMPHGNALRPAINVIIAKSMPKISSERALE